MIAVLHTWGSNMSEHNHLHTIVPAGGLNKDGAWCDSKKSGCFFERMTKVAKTFKRFYIELLEELYDQGKLDLSGKDLADFDNIDRWYAFLRSVAQKKWVIHTKEPMNAVKHVIDYLARYVNRIAITNSRILEIKADKIVIRYKQYQQQKDADDMVPEATMELDGQEFVRRFVQHILPKGFQKCRFYGIYAAAAKKKSEKARASMGNRDWCVTLRTVVQIVAKMIGQDPDICPHCSAKSRFEITNITEQRPDLYRHHAKVDTKCPRPPPGHETILVF